VATWCATIQRDQLLIHLEAARPPGRGPFATVLVHPEGGRMANDMKGILWDLAGRGYLAIGADYQRMIDGKPKGTLFAWRSAADVTAVLDLTRDYADVDQQRIGVLGFSQGGVYSLLIAAYAPERVRAVVAYYPVTDFPHWLGAERSGFWQRQIHDVIRWYFRRESQTNDEAEFQAMLREASPYYVADAIQAPVLLIHGERDTTAPVEESQRMADRLSALGKTVQLMVVPGAVHIFNFRQPEQAAVAWEATLQWLDRYLARPPN
jgi:dipeptidyl aminopeptidase/acylaminoacyl peptidase